jgi:hypothetical protein
MLNKIHTAASALTFLLFALALAAPTTAPAQVVVTSRPTTVGGSPAAELTFADGTTALTILSAGEHGDADIKCADCRREVTLTGSSPNTRTDASTDISQPVIAGTCDLQQLWFPWGPVFLCTPFAPCTFTAKLEVRVTGDVNVEVYRRVGNLLVKFGTVVPAFPHRVFTFDHSDACGQYQDMEIVLREMTPTNPPVSSDYTLNLRVGCSPCATPIVVQ